MNSTTSDDPHWPWLEVFLVVAVIALLCQLFPTPFDYVLWAADVRNWSRGAWVAAAAVVGLILASIRFGPELMISQRTKSARQAQMRAQSEKQRRAIEARKLREGIEESRKRVIY